jgi:hypothetical protein
MVEKCYHKSKKLVEKKLINCELLYSAFFAMITKTTYQIFYECMDCKEKWTETKKDILEEAWLGSDQGKYLIL